MAGDASPTPSHPHLVEDTAGEHDVYDNGTAQPIGGGSIVVHTKK